MRYQYRIIFKFYCEYGIFYFTFLPGIATVYVQDYADMNIPWRWYYIIKGRNSNDNSVLIAPVLRYTALLHTGECLRQSRQASDTQEAGRLFGSSP